MLKSQYSQRGGANIHLIGSQLRASMQLPQTKLLVAAFFRQQTKMHINLYN